VALVEDHKRLFELALAKDLDAAKQVIRQHVMSGVDHVRKAVKLR
jgi:DNA-binding GntR family transcriptional regulator